jgi:hypothetical protein
MATMAHICAVSHLKARNASLVNIADKAAHAITRLRKHNRPNA